MRSTFLRFDTHPAECGLILRCFTRYAVCTASKNVFTQFCDKPMTSGCPIPCSNPSMLALDIQ